MNSMTRTSSGRWIGFVAFLFASMATAADLPAGGAGAFRLMVKGDPATTITIGFNATSARAEDHRVHYGTVDQGRNASAYALSEKPAVIHAFKGMKNAFVRLSQLKPDTAYYFVVADPKGVSRRFWFKTAPASPDRRLSVIAGGDSRNNRTPRRNANLLVSKLRAHVVMFAGDMTASGTDKEWGEWFADWQLTIPADGRMTPVLAARGNHEANNEILEKLFDTTPGVYYGVTYGGLLRIYTLNSESGISGTQTSWLADDLHRHNAIPWKFAQYHRPMRPHVTGKSEGTAQYRAWADLFHKYRMTVVSEADAHTVKATWPIRPSQSGGNDEGFVRDDDEGTVYIGEGCWGAPLRTNNDNKSWTRASDRFNHFNLIFVSRRNVEIRTVRVDNAASVGSVTDANPFALPKGLDLWAPKTGDVVSIEARQ